MAPARTEARKVRNFHDKIFPIFHGEFDTYHKKLVEAKKLHFRGIFLRILNYSWDERENFHDFSKKRYEKLENLNFKL